MSDVRARLLGSWRMIDWKLETSGGFVDPPLGPSDACGGILIYADEGAMSVVLSASSRPRFADDFVGAGSTLEKAQAFDSIICYSGTFEIDESSATVTHHVEFATFPNYVGRVLRRVCIFDGDTLRLDTPPMAFGGEALASYILWKRFR